MAGRKYTNQFEVFNDINLYTSLTVGGGFNLSMFPSIAQNRWPWMVQQWATLFKKLQSIGNGDQNYLNILNDLDNFVTSYLLGNSQNPFESSANFIKFIPVIQNIKLGDFSLTVDEIILKDQEIERISQLEIEDFQAMVTFLRQNSAIQSQVIGLGDADAASLIGINVADTQRSATIADLENINNTIELEQYIFGIIFALKQNQKKPPNLLALSNQDVDPTSPVSFNDTYRSYISAPYEISLEHMAQKYLGGQERWFELVTVNNLQPNYVDESGEKFPLLAPAAVNNLIISDLRKEYVAVGAKVRIGSYRFKEETRIVEKIIVNENQTMILFLSGNQDLNKFQTTDSAYVKIFRPNTTRKGEFLLIPLFSSSSIPTNIPTPQSDELRRLDKALLAFGVDIARDEDTNDLIIDPNGNFKMSYGTDLVRQSVLSALKTIRGELPFHADYGVNLNIGGRFFGTTDEALIFGELLRDSILRDNRIEDVTIYKVSTTGTGISLTLIVTIAGASQPIPLSFIS